MEMLVPCWPSAGELAEPADAETTTCDVPTGVPVNDVPVVVPDPELFPPHARLNDTAVSRSMVTMKKLGRLLAFLRRTAGRKSIAAANVPPCIQSHFNEGPDSPERIDGAVVVTVSVVAADAPFAIREAGENEQLAPAGSPVQANETAWLKPFIGITVSLNVADWPRLMVAEVGEASTA
jgi:hypothetical protein